MKLAVIGNCQVTPLGRILAQLCPGASVDAYEVWRMTAADFEAAAEKVPGYDILISQPLNAPKYGVFTTRELREALRPPQQLVTIHNIHFEGTMPDCTYVGPMGARVTSPLSNYHSRIIVDAYLAGQSVEDCARTVAEGGEMQPARRWKENMAEFERRETAVDVPFAAQLVEEIKARNCLYVFNHPSQRLLERYAQAILRHLFGAKAPRGDAGAPALPDMLIRHGVWPVYDWIAEKFSLPYRSSLYVPSRTSKLPPLSIREFAEASYRIYDSVPREKLIY